jgi:molecular chaperone GrpE
MSNEQLFNTFFGDIFNSSAFNTVTGNPTPPTDNEDDKVDWKSAYLSMKSDFDAYRKRTENGRSMEKQNLTKELIRGFLEVVDFTIFTYKAKNQMGTYTKEDKMILDKISSLLKSYDVYPMKDPTGHPFDHRYHEAVCSDESEMFESGTVTLLVSHGYMIGDEVLRYAKVIVAK